MVPFIRQVSIENYKSIARAAPTLERFTVLVGPNGAGKSNFLDSLAFVQECLADSIELAFKNRGGIGAVRRRSGGHPTHIGLRLVLELGDGVAADYSFQIAAKPMERFTVARERCAIHPLLGKETVFDVREGEFTTRIRGIRPKMAPDRLALFAASATDEFRPVYDFLTSMRAYSVVPVSLREWQDPDPGGFLKRDGSNAAAVLKRLQNDPNGSERYERIGRLLLRVVEGLRRVEYRPAGQKETLRFFQEVGQKHPWAFDALSMSDGTLRVLGLLLAVHQPGAPSVLAIEEPEATVHPSVAEMVVEVLLDAARERQVLLTTHSPDILDYKELTDSQIRVVTTNQNRTLISPLSETSREAVRNRLYTPGELLRVGELQPAPASPSDQQLGLFGTPFPRGDTEQ